MNVHDDTHIFDQVFRVWVQRTCREWNFELPPESYYSEVYARLPVGLHTTLEFGYKQGLLLDAGKSDTGSAGFRPKGVPESKGQYSWFEKDSQKKQPRPAWECFIQAAEYVRLYETFKDKDHVLTFEDDLAVHYIFVTFLVAGPSRSCTTSKLTRSPSHRFLNRGILIER